MAATGCAAGRFGDHDYSQPPHNTPSEPHISVDPCPCQAGVTLPWGEGCQFQAVYQVTVYQPGTHDWVRLNACIPCTAAIRRRCDARVGPHGPEHGVARVCQIGCLEPASAAPPGVDPARQEQGPASHFGAGPLPGEE